MQILQVPVGPHCLVISVNNVTRTSKRVKRAEQQITRLKMALNMYVDEEAGDRRCPCRQGMKPIGIAIRDDGEWSLIHKCAGCGQLRTNRIAGDDHELSLLSLALRPLALAPFPIDDLRPGLGC